MDSGVESTPRARNVNWVVLAQVALGLVLIVSLLLGTAQLLLKTSWPAGPVVVTILGLPPEAEDNILIMMVDRNQKIHGLPRLGPPFFWSVEQTPLQTLLFQIPEPELAGLDKMVITLRDQQFSFSRDDMQHWPQQEIQRATEGTIVRQILRRLPDSFGQTSILPWVPQPYLNWRGDGFYLAAIGQYAAVPILLVCFLGYFHWKSRAQSGREKSLFLLGLQSREPVKFSNRRIWNWGSLGFLIIILTWLEVSEPYYFTQCDNLVDCLPQILLGCRSFWQGQFPHYNPYLFLGSPLANQGIYSLTYPPLHLSYALARHGLGQEYATVEVFAILHLLVGFWVTRLLGQRLGMGPLPANATALCCVLSGSSLILGRSWFNFIPLVVWLPVVFLGLMRLLQGPVRWPWVIGMGLALGMPFHVGFSQVALYLNIFFGLGGLWLFAAGSLPVRRLLPVLASLLIGAGVALPLVYQQWLLTRGISRVPAIDHGLGWGLPAMLMPYPLAEVPLPTFWGNENLHLVGHFYFFGGLLFFLFLLQVMGLCYFRPGRKRWAGQLWTIAAVVALWLGLGEMAGLWTLLSHMPLIGFINRYPLRLMPFVVFFASLSGGLVLERLLTLWDRRERTEWLVGIPLVVVLALHAQQCRTAFHYYRFSPYPPLDPALQNQVMKDGQPTQRLFSWVVHSWDETYGLLQSNNLPSLVQVPTLLGYNSLLDGAPQIIQMTREWAQGPRKTMQAYGVRWHFLQEPETFPWLTDPLSLAWRRDVFSNQVGLGLMKKLAPDQFPQVFRGQGFAVHELAPVDPLAFPQGKPKQSLPVQMHGLGIDVKVAGLSEAQVVVVNFLRIADLQAYVDGQPVPCGHDSWNRILVQVPPRSQKLSIRYEPPWTHGLWMGLAAISLGLGLAKYNSA